MGFLVTLGSIMHSIDKSNSNWMRGVKFQCICKILLKLECFQVEVIGSGLNVWGKDNISWVHTALAKLKD